MNADEDLTLSAFLISSNMKTKPVLLLLTFSFLISLTSLTQEKKPITQGPEKGHLIIVGGNMTDPAIYDKFMELSGGADAKIVIVITAGSDDYLFEQGGLDYTEKSPL